MVYYVGTSKRNRTLVIEARRNKDFLSCELYDYFGEREVTKVYLKKYRYQFLDYLKQTKPLVYSGLLYAVVD